MILNEEKLLETNQYCYIYLDPRKSGIFEYDDLNFEYEPIYVGRGCNDRKYNHIYRFKKKKWKNHPFMQKLKKIYDLGLEPIVLTLKENMNVFEANIMEISLIAKIGRNNLNKGPLTNLTDGGEGITGYVYTEEDKRRKCLSLLRAHLNDPTIRIRMSISLKKWHDENKESFSQIQKEAQSRLELREAKSIFFLKMAFRE